MEMICQVIAAEDGPGLECFLIFLVLFGISGLLKFFNHSKEKSRTGRMAIAVEKMGLEFQPTGDPVLLFRLSDFPMTNVGEQRQLKNLVVGDTSQGKLVLFDYSFVERSRPGSWLSQTHRQTVIAMGAPGLQQLPVFNMRPTRRLDMLTGEFGLRDVDFSDHQEFSEKFLLKGEDEEQLRSFMDKDLLDFFVDRPDLCCEARPGTFLYYRRWECVEPEAHLLEAFLEQGMMVFVALMERQMRG